MQNHAGYDQYNIPEDQMRSMAPDYLDETVTHELNEYLSCIDASDHDLEWFVSQLRELDRPVVLVFFGDHQPNIGMNLNDALYTADDEATHAARAYETNYVVWANYDVAGTDEMRWEQASTSTLGRRHGRRRGSPAHHLPEGRYGRTPRDAGHQPVCLRGQPGLLAQQPPD